MSFGSPSSTFALGIPHAIQGQCLQVHPCSLARWAWDCDMTVKSLQQSSQSNPFRNGNNMKTYSRLIPFK